MPGPFPGMDPYMEDRRRWPGVHQALIGSIRTLLNRLLPAGYAADAGERIYLARSDRDIYPDVVVARRGPPPGPAEQKTAERADSLPWRVRTPEAEVREPFIEVVAAAEGRVVSVIELLSPSNKTAGSEGRKLYLEKQRQLLSSDVSLIEIDLLHDGEHTVAAPRVELERRGTWDYLVCLYRGGTGPEFEVWPCHLREPLPIVSVPLAGGDPDVCLPLQEALDQAYDGGGYRTLLNYGQGLLPWLTPQDQDWARSVLQEQGRR